MSVEHAAPDPLLSAGPVAESPSASAAPKAPPSSKIERPTATEPEPPGIFGLVDALLRNHRRIIDRIEADDRLIDLARGLVVIILVGAAIFGAAMGFYRGGIQMLFAAIKLPLAILLTAALSVPAYMAMNTAANREARPRQDACLVLLALAGASLIISATAPFIVLAAFWGYGYHSTILLVVACCAVGGLYGLAIFVRGVARRAGPARILIGLGPAALPGAPAHGAGALHSRHRGLVHGLGQPQLRLRPRGLSARGRALAERR